MHDELGMDDGRDSGGCDHWKSGAICFVSFLANGLVPLLGYVAFMPAGFEKQTLFYISCSLTATMLFVLGAVKSRFTTRTAKPAAVKTFCAPLTLYRKKSSGTPWYGYMKGTVKMTTPPGFIVR